MTFSDGAAQRAAATAQVFVADLERLELEIFDGNEASVRVAQRCGFQFEGLLRSRELHRGRRRDVALYARIRR